MSLPLLLATHSLIISRNLSTVSQDVNSPLRHESLSITPKSQAEMSLGSEDIMDLLILHGCPCLPLSLQLMMNGAELECKRLAVI